MNKKEGEGGGRDKSQEVTEQGNNCCTYFSCIYISSRETSALRFSMAVMTIKVLATCAVVGFVLANLVHTSIAQSTPPLNEAGFFYGKDVIKQATDMLVIKALERQESILRDYVAFKSISSLYDQFGNETIACAEWLVRNAYYLKTFRLPC